MKETPMQTKIAERFPVRGRLRTLMLLPIWLYRLRLGWLLGERGLMLTHIAGRAASCAGPCWRSVGMTRPPTPTRSSRAGAIEATGSATSSSGPMRWWTSGGGGSRPPPGACQKQRRKAGLATSRVAGRLSFAPWCAWRLASRRRERMATIARSPVLSRWSPSGPGNHSHEWPALRSVQNRARHSRRRSTPIRRGTFARSTIFDCHSSSATSYDVRRLIMPYVSNAIITLQTVLLLSHL